MHRFWNRYIKNIVEVVRPARILEIGAEYGWNTRHVLAYCKDNGCHADIIDPAPQADLHQVLSGFGNEHYTFHQKRSVQVIPEVPAHDMVLLDGDHNWATVFEELTLIHSRALDSGTLPPLILFHDVAWPYARRDMYYNPDGPIIEKHPYAYSGMLPGISELVEHGFNCRFANATHEGGPRNGVLTAVEDFIASLPTKVYLYKLPFFNGLGIFVPEERMDSGLKAVIDSFFTADAMLTACMELENDAMHLRATLEQTESRLTRRTQALVRARELLVEQADRIKALEAANREAAGLEAG